MNGWILLLAIAGGIILAAICIFVFIPFLAHVLYKIAEFGKRVGYARRAKKRNEEARQLRLARTNYQGWPLPASKKGELVITTAMQIALPPKSYNEINRIYQDRARDLGVTLYIQKQMANSDIKLSWEPTRSIKE